MTLLEIYDFFDLMTGQERGGFNTYAEKDAALDRASMSVFEYYRPIYATSIEAKEALAPFRVKYDYVTSGTGQITLTSGQEFIRLLSMDVTLADPDSPSGFDPNRRFPVTFVNEDDLADRINSQNKQPTRTAPIADSHGVGWYDLYPRVVHAGTIYFLKRPAKPFFAYSLSGRMVVEDDADTVNIEWTEPYINRVIFIALRYLGVNLDNDKLISEMDTFFKANG